MTDPSAQLSSRPPVRRNPSRTVPTARLLETCCERCTHTLSTPCRDAIVCASSGPLCHDDATCRTERTRRLETARRGGEGTLIFVGAGTCGRANGATQVIAHIHAFLRDQGLRATVVEVGCMGFCQREVFVDILRPGAPRLTYCDIHPENVDAFLTRTLAEGETINEFLLCRHGEAEGELAGIPDVRQVPFFAKQVKVVLENCGLIDPGSLDAALARGAFSAAAKALSSMTPEEVCALVTASGLRGRGGAGFVTGQKWSIARTTPSAEKYVICNADEGDPGAFMDRAVLESDPFRVLEGMLIAAYAIGAPHGYIYCRAEYPLAIERLQGAIDQCRTAGLLGHDILGSLVTFDVRIKQGAGAFVCGEETAILASIQGGRGMPRPRPPYPAVSGLHGKPTVLNNVETLANVPPIVSHGAAWFDDLGIGTASGTKVFALSGTVRNTGLVEVPVGVSLREIVEDIGGGAPHGHHIKAVQIGGPSGGCIPANQLDVAVDYAALLQLGAMMGSGGMVVMDERSCMVDVARYFMEFICNESCGKCTPCREGTTRMCEILTALTERPAGDELKRLERYQGVFHLEELARTVQEASLCGLGQSAANPVLSTLRFFRDEYRAHVLESRCPAGACQGLRTFEIDNATCVGCLLCKQKCPADAIVGQRKQAHYVIVDKCTGCGSCLEVCPKHAVKLVQEQG